MAVRMMFGCLLALLVSSVQITAQSCKEGWVYYNGNCYGYGDSPVSWTEAATICNLWKSKLAEVESEDENNFIAEHLNNNTDASRVWLGGTDIFNEGNWIWVSTRAHIFPYHNWHDGQPSDSGSQGEDCVAFYASYNYQWADETCAHENNFICEKPENEDLEIIIG